MQKINLIWFLIILSTGCSVLKTKTQREFDKSVDINKEQLFESIVKQNISANSFFISKAEFKISSQDVTEGFLGSIKFETTGKFLISLKSKTGIEALRIFISEDTVLINDRLNKKLYCGSTLDLKRKFGISVKALPLIFGDFISKRTRDTDSENCIEGRMNLNADINGLKVMYVIDCKKGKVLQTGIVNSLNKTGVEMEYRYFVKSGTSLIPEEIQIKDLNRNIKIEISIKKIESPWNGNIEFIPGNKYEILPLQ